jgi:hypothetical protein
MARTDGHGSWAVGMGRSKLPSLHLFLGDWLRCAGKCSLSAQGLWLRMSFLMHDSERYGYLCSNKLPMNPDDIARGCGVLLGEYAATLAELDRFGVPSRTSDGIIFSQELVEAEQKRRIRKKNGRLGGNPLLNLLVKPQHNQRVIQNADVDVDVSSSGKGDARGKGNADPTSEDELDNEIHIYFRDHVGLMWNRRAHIETRKMIECVGWEKTKSAVNEAIKRGASMPTAYAIRVLGNKQAKKATEPQASAPGSWVKKPYVPG